MKKAEIVIIHPGVLGIQEMAPKQASQVELESSLVGLGLGLPKCAHHSGANPFCNQFLHYIISSFFILPDTADEIFTYLLRSDS